MTLPIGSIVSMVILKNRNAAPAGRLAFGGGKWPAPYVVSEHTDRQIVILDRTENTLIIFVTARILTIHVEWN